MELNDRRTGGIKYSEACGSVICPEYMLHTASRNKSRRIVPFEIIADLDPSTIIYSTDLLMSARHCLEEYGADEQWMRTFLHSADEVLAYCGEYLIDPSHINAGLDNIFLAGPSESAVFVFNPFEKNDFHESFRRTTAEILGNYFSDHAVSGEVFRERLLRETAMKDFNPRNVIAGWDRLVMCERQDDEVIVKPRDHAPRRRMDFLREMLPSQKSLDEETAAIGNSADGPVLTGICSRNTRIPVKSEGVTVGRTMLQKEFGLFNGGIGRVHARIYEQGEKVFVTDLGSRNGTYVNGERIQRRFPVQIEKGDIVAFSDEEFILC